MLIQLRFRTMLAKAGLILLTSLALVGCGGDTGNRLSGKVTFKGQPVPSGKVYIVPDSSKGNKGAGGYADITNGSYDTSAPGGRGAVAGAVTITVEGIDPKPPPGAEPDVTTTILFTNYEIKAELPASASVKDIDVPASAAGGGTAQPASNPMIVP